MTVSITSKNPSTADAISCTHQSYSCGNEQPQAENPTHRAHNLTMPPKSTRVRKWSKADDQKLQDLVRRKVNGITISRAKSNIKKLIKHWPDRKKNFKSFGALVHPKLQQLELDGYLLHAPKIHKGGSFSCVETKRFQVTHLISFEDDTDNEDEDYDEASDADVSLESLITSTMRTSSKTSSKTTCLCPRPPGRRWCPQHARSPPWFSS